jgi:SSS family solute:Na+ symporter/sodium/proline symporter
VRWLLLPLGWLIGDILFWRVFPSRVNAFGKRSRATTLSELLTLDVPGRTGTILSLLAAALVTICLAGYIAAQWLAGQKFLAGAFGVPDIAALGLFALMIVSYTAIGGFRGSVYVDSLQAVVRVIGTALALGAVWFVARSDAGNGPRLAAAGPHFLDLLGDGGAATAAGTLLGFAAAALGFGLGQPQIISRYLAGASPRETQAAWWIYMGFVQFTWISMTLFGVMLRGVMPALADPEAGLSVFFETKMPPVLTGIIIADVFATIAATSNALLVAIGQSVAHDVAPRLLRRGATLPLGPVCAVIGAATMGLSLATDSSVMSLALGSVSLIGAGLAPAVMARVLGWRFTGVSLIAAVVTGVVVALAWRLAGLAGTINEAAPGIAAGMLANALVARLTPRAVV